MILSHEEARLLAQYVVARNAQAWEVDWEAWPNLDEDSVNMLNDAIVDVGNWIERVTAHDEVLSDKDVRFLFEQATS